MSAREYMIVPKDAKDLNKMARKIKFYKDYLGWTGGVVGISEAKQDLSVNGFNVPKGTKMLCIWSEMGAHWRRIDKYTAGYMWVDECLVNKAGERQYRYSDLFQDYDRKGNLLESSEITPPSLKLWRTSDFNINIINKNSQEYKEYIRQGGGSSGIYDVSSNEVLLNFVWTNRNFIEPSKIVFRDSFDNLSPLFDNKGENKLLQQQSNDYKNELDTTSVKEEKKENEYTRYDESDEMDYEQKLRMQTDNELNKELSELPSEQHKMYLETNLEVNLAMRDVIRKKLDYVDGLYADSASNYVFFKRESINEKLKEINDTSSLTDENVDIKKSMEDSLIKRYAELFSDNILQYYGWDSEGLKTTIKETLEKNRKNNSLIENGGNSKGLNMMKSSLPAKQVSNEQASNGNVFFG